MSIATKTGDNGTTGLLFGTRVSKSDKRIAAVGDIDELCAAIGMVKPLINKFVMREYYPELLSTIQRTLTFVMGEIATEPNKRKSYSEKYDCLGEQDLARLDLEIKNLEKDPNTKQTDWVIYGQSEIGASCDFASKVCRRAERTFSIAKEQEQIEDPSWHYRPILSQYINRLSDMLHLLARYFDSISAPVKPTKLPYRYE